MPKLIGGDLLPGGKLLENIHAIIKSEGINEYKIEIKRATTKGDNYIGQILSLDISGYDTNGNPKILHLIGKHSPRMGEFTEIMPLQNFFSREVFIYKDYLPFLYEIQQSHGLVLLKPVAKMYACSTTPKDEYIIMENLKVDGFQMMDRIKPLDYHHSTMVLKQLGYLHGLGFVFKKDNYEKYCTLVAPYRDHLTSQYPQIGDIWYKSCKNMLGKAAMQFDPIKEKEAFDKVSQLQDKALDYFNDSALNKYFDEKYSIIVHGDCWVNNLLFKYDSEQLIDVRILDWQIIRVASPVLDLAYFLSMSVGTELRDQHYQEMKNIYYNALKEAVELCGHSVKEIYPIDIFEEELKKYYKLMLCLSSQFIAMFTRNSEEIPDYHNSQEFQGWDNLQTVSKNEDIYKERIRGVMLHAIKNRFI